MLQKINTRTLAFVLIALIGVYVLAQVFKTNTDRNFRELLVKIQPDKITSMEFSKPGNEPFQILREGENWFISQNNNKLRADQQAIQSVLNELNKLEIAQRAGTKKEQWKKYEVTDSLATRLALYENKQLITELMIGKMSYKQVGQQFAISSYVRLSNEKEVFSLENSLSMTAKRDFNSFRNHDLLSLSKGQINSVTFDYPADSGFVVSKSGSQWWLGDMMIDSTKVQQYLSSIEQFKGRKFAETFQPDGREIWKVNFQNSQMETITVEAYKNNEEYVIRSSQNEEAVFSENKQQFDKLFWKSLTFMDLQ